MDASQASEKKKCAGCGQMVESGLLRCPKCGQGKFEMPKAYKTTAGQDVDEIRKQIAMDYPTDWLRRIEFLCFSTEEQLKSHLFRTIEEARPQRVLVVGGVDLFKKLSDKDLPAYDILVNTIHDLGWLCEFCKYVRNSQTPSIVVSNFPREYAPPTVRCAVGDNFVAKVGYFEGPVYRTTAPTEASVALCEENDQESTMGVFFCGLHALSYYNAVLQSQRRRPDQLLKCTVLATLADNIITNNEHEMLKSCQDHAEHRRILIEASEACELIARRYEGDRYRESTAYSGGILDNYTIPKRIPSRPRTLLRPKSIRLFGNLFNKDEKKQRKV